MCYYHCAKRRHARCHGGQEIQSIRYRRRWRSFYTSMHAGLVLWRRVCGHCSRRRLGLGADSFPVSSCWYFYCKFEEGRLEREEVEAKGMMGRKGDKEDRVLIAEVQHLLA